MGPLLEQVGGGKESLSFMKRRIRRLAPQWASAARRLDDRLRHLVMEQKRSLSPSSEQFPRRARTRVRQGPPDGSQRAVLNPAVRLFGRPLRDRQARVHSVMEGVLTGPRLTLDPKHPSSLVAREELEAVARDGGVLGPRLPR
ncbi:unnamed protein product [Arctogadus glacialis]